MRAPIPREPIFHLLALFPTMNGLLMDSFLAHARANFPQMETQRPDWTVIGGAQGRMYGTLGFSGWDWHLLVAGGPVPESLQDLYFGGPIAKSAHVEVREHRAHALLFLTAAPFQPVNRIRSTLALAWGLKRGGASMFAFLSSLRIWRLAQESDEVPSMDEGFLCDHLLDRRNLGYGTDGRLWVSTRGMDYFGFADACCSVASQPEHDEALVFLESVPVYLLKIGRQLAEDEIIQFEGNTWRVGGPNDLAPAPIDPARARELAVFVKC